MKRITKYIAVGLLAVIGLSSCIAESLKGDSSGDATIVLTLKMPHVSSTRAITETPFEENRIDEVNVLAFVKDNSGDWVYEYAATNVVISSTSGNDMTVTARVIEKSVPQCFVILANSSGELASAAPVRGEKMENIENRIVCSTGGGEWPAKINGVPFFTPFPMYARTRGETVSANTINNIGIYPMIRMVARIDVSLNYSVNNFILANACLFNYKTAGYVSYGNSGFYESNATVSYPAVPSSGDHTGNPIKRPHVFYEAVNSVIERSIYTFESEAFVSEAERTTKTALVIGGFYNGEQEICFYRIDLKDAGFASFNISDGILRNHLYNVTVQSVAGPGYKSPEDAYLGSSRLTAEVISWNPMTQSVIDDGQYFLTVSTDELSFGYKGGEINFVSETDYNRVDQGFLTGVYIDPSEIVYTPEVTSGAGWLTLEEVDGTNGSFKLETKATVSPNTSGEERSAKIRVKAGNLIKIIRVVQASGAPSIPIVFDETPVGDCTYVGAFWRAEHTGERLISIPVPSGAEGKWTVQVYDTRGFDDGDIVFSTEASTDPYLYTDYTADMIAYDSEYQVDGNEEFVSGTASAGGKIFFRVGLKTKWRDQPGYGEDWPARYAVLVLSYKDNTRYQKIYLRQGHEPDFLMRKYDPMGSYSTRPNAGKFSPYNLTASSSAQSVTLSVRGGVPTAYPSQSGYFFRYNTPLTAYHPTNPTGTIAGWLVDNNALWSATMETCPTGFHRPADHTLTTNYGDYRYSEMRQSLFATPSNAGLNTDVDNTVFGYYADGFFDRRLIGTGSGSSGVANSVVANGTVNAAYIGRLFYNSESLASLFFPSGGSRSHYNTIISGGGALEGAGNSARYWVTSLNNLGTSGGCLEVSSSRAYMGADYNSAGHSIRCVKDN